MDTEEVVTVILRGDQIGASGISTVVGGYLYGGSGNLWVYRLVRKPLWRQLRQRRLMEFPFGPTDDFINIVGTSPVENTLKGSNEADTMHGNIGRDTIQGRGGDDIISASDGNDKLTGGGGEDQFWFDLLLDASSNVDRITDFQPDGDTIVLSRWVFTGIRPGSLPEEAFALGTAAADSDDRIIYDQATGYLYFDSDGTGASAQTLFAIIGNQAALTHEDIEIL